MPYRPADYEPRVHIGGRIDEEVETRDAGKIVVVDGSK